MRDTARALDASGILLRRGEHGYEPARLAACWNGRVPDRFPDLIVRARSADDVALALRLAGDQDLRVGVRSGGHSWTGSFLRAGLLLDLSQMTGITVDPEAMTATVEPACIGWTLDATLRRHGLFFPVGHCRDVALGGYLLQGGFGWHSRTLGPACQSVIAVDVVTAAGEPVHADPTNHPDLYWAARGAGSGFFAAATRFYLRVYPRPAAMRTSAYLYPVDCLDDIVAWAAEVGPHTPPTMELLVIVARGLADPVASHPAGHRAGDLGGGRAGRRESEPVVLVTGPVLADTAEDARQALQLLESCPARARALAAATCVPTEIDALLADSDQLYPPGRRYAVDGMWTHAPAATLLPGVRQIAKTLEALPPGPSHVMWMQWGPPPTRPDMAFSLEDSVYLAAYAVWEDPAGDADCQRWATEHMRAMAPLAAGIQLADENLAARPAPFLAAENLRRLDAVRARYDPHARFHSWMGRP